MRAGALRLSVVLLAGLIAGCGTARPRGAAGPSGATAAHEGAPGGATAGTSGWHARPEVVAEAAARDPSINYDEARVPPYVLPDVFGGARTPAAWARRRAELLALFRTHVYGHAPGRPEGLRFEVLEEDPRAMGGAATLRRVAIVSRQAGREHRFGLTLFVPNARRAPVPVFLLLNNRPPGNTDPTRAERSGFWPAEAVVARGYGIAALQVGDLAPDDSAHFREGVIRLFEGAPAGPRAPDAWGALAAWAWGASRTLDYLATDPRVDAARVAVVGHSRGAKAALWAGAQDERFALVVANNSGEGGAALSRRQFGETVARITTSFPHWFAAGFRSYAGREAARPTDQHQLLALVAPRALYVASAGDDLWADPRGEFLALAHASPAYALWDDPPIRPADMPPLGRPLVAGRRAYHVRRGGHDLTPSNWQQFVDFADVLWQP